MKVTSQAGYGLMSNSDKVKLDGLTNYTHPANHPASIITQDSNNRFVTDAEKTSWNNKLSSFTETDPTAVKLTGNQTISGIKTFNDDLRFGSATSKWLYLDNDSRIVSGGNTAYQLDIDGLTNLSALRVNGNFTVNSNSRQMIQFGDTNTTNGQYFIGRGGNNSNPNLTLHIDGTDPSSEFKFMKSGGSTVMSIKNNGDTSFNGRLAFRTNDTRLRLNQNGDFTSGVYTPGALRADGGLIWANGNDGVKVKHDNVAGRGESFYKWASGDLFKFFNGPEGNSDPIMTIGNDSVRILGNRGLQISGGSPSAGKVWTASDSNGNGSWGGAGGTCKFQFVSNPILGVNTYTNPLGEVPSYLEFNIFASNNSSDTYLEGTYTRQGFGFYDVSSGIQRGLSSRGTGYGNSVVGYIFETNYSPSKLRITEVNSTQIKIECFTSCNTGDNYHKIIIKVCK